MSYLTLKCTKFNFGWGSAPDPRPHWKSLQRSLRPFIPDSRDPTFKANGQNERKEGKGKERAMAYRQGRGFSASII